MVDDAPVVDRVPEVRDAEADDELRRSRRNFVLGLLVAFGVLSFFVLEPFLSYALMGLLLAYLTEPAYRRVLAIVRRPALAAGIVLVATSLLVVGPLAWIGFEVVGTVRAFTAEAGSIQAALADVADRMARLFGVDAEAGPGPGAAAVDAMARAVEAWARAHAGDLLALAGSVAVGLVVLLFVLYYALKDGRAFVDFLVDASPLDDELDRELILEVRKTVDAVFLGHIIVAAVQGIVGGVGLLVFGVPNAVFWGFVMIVLALIPLVGAFVVWLPAGLWLLASGDTVGGVGVLVWGALVVSTIDNFLRPKIVGSRADIHPVLVLVGVLGGITAFGLIGFVLGPLVLAMLVAIVNFWRRDFLPRYEAQHKLPPALPPPREGAASATTPER